MKDTNITHLSTWMLVKGREDDSKKLEGITGEDVVPLKVRVR